MSNDPSQQPTSGAPTSSPDGNVPPIAPDGSQSQLPDASALIATTERVQGNKNQLKPKRKHPSAFRKVRAKVQHFQMQRLRQAENPTPQQERKRAVYELRLPWWQKAWRWTGLGDKNGWDWAQLLAVPIMLAIVSWGLSEYAKSRDQLQQQADKEKEQALADDKAKQDTLVKYLDDMAGSLKDGLLDAAPGSKAFIIAQSRTVLALQSLDKKRQHLVLRFLDASGLNQLGDDKDTQKFLKKLSDYTNGRRRKKPVPSNKVQLGLLYGAQMARANLADSDLNGIVMIRANLNGVNLGCNPPHSQEREHCSDLSGADLSYADLGGADLSGSNFLGVIFKGTNLYGANFSGARLSSARFDGTDLRFADLSNTDLRFADLSGAELDYANLTEAILLNANLANVQELPPEQLTGDKAPLLCNVRFPKSIKGIDPNRDCDLIPQVLMKRYPKAFPELQKAKKYVNGARQQKFQ